jgi:hypothetical protein
MSRNVRFRSDFVFSVTDQNSFFTSVNYNSLKVGNKRSHAPAHNKLRHGSSG